MNKKNFKLIIYPLKAYALETNISKEAVGKFEITDLGKFVSNILRASLIVSGILVLIYLLWGAVDYLMSEGDQEKLKNAKNKMIHALAGIVILSLVWLIWLAVLYFLGLGKISKTEVSF